MEWYNPGFAAFGIVWLRLVKIFSGSHQTFQGDVHSSRLYLLLLKYSIPKQGWFNISIVLLVGGGLIFLFSPRSLGGEMIQFDQYFQMGWFNHQLENPLLIKD